MVYPKGTNKSGNEATDATSRTSLTPASAAASALTLPAFRQWMRQRTRTHPDGQDVTVGTSAGAFEDCPLATYLRDHLRAPVVWVGPLDAELFFGSPSQGIAPGDSDDAGTSIPLPDWAQTFVWAVDRLFETPGHAPVLGAPVPVKWALRLLAKIEQGRLTIPPDERPM